MVVLNKSCYDYIGRFALTVTVKDGEDETTVFYGDGYMHGHRTDTVITGEYIIYDINMLLQKIAEIDAATSAANDAAQNANAAASDATTAADTANTAAGSANSAASRANAAAAAIEGITATATALGTGEAATAAVQVVDGHYVLALGLPRGLTGATPQITFQVATGAPGTDASAVVTGTPEAPHVLLTIPRGDVGNIGNLKVNGKTPGADGSVTVGIDDIDGLRSAIDNAGGVKTVAGVSPDEAGNVALTARDVGAVSMELLLSIDTVAAISDKYYYMDLSGYDSVLIETQASTATTRCTMTEIAVGGSGDLYFLSGYHNHFYSRTVTVTAEYVKTAGGYKAGVADNTVCLPKRIWGIKGRLSA